MDGFLALCGSPTAQIPGQPQQVWFQHVHEGIYIVLCESSVASFEPFAVSCEYVQSRDAVGGVGREVDICGCTKSVWWWESLTVGAGRPDNQRVNGNRCFRYWPLFTWVRSLHAHLISQYAVGSTCSS